MPHPLTLERIGRSLRRRLDARLFQAERISQPWRDVRRTTFLASLKSGPIEANVFGVYRRRNARYVEMFREQCGPSAHHFWWALDEVAPTLDDLTFGCGPGPKFELLNQLLALSSPSGEIWSVFADDDVVFRRGDLQRLLVLATKADFAMAQPAHDVSSLFSYRFNVARPGAFASLTRFVEIGPLFLIHPEKQQTYLPFPTGASMGYGLEVEWAALSRSAGHNIGVVDAVRVIHCEPVGKSYDLRAAQTQTDRALMANGLTSVKDIQKREQIWWRYTRHPRWVGD